MKLNAHTVMKMLHLGPTVPSKWHGMWAKVNYSFRSSELMYTQQNNSRYMSKWILHAEESEMRSTSHESPGTKEGERLAGMEKSQGNGSLFESLGVDPRLLPCLKNDMGIVEPTAIQIAAIPSILSGKNAALQCYTGSGKTLAYLLPVLSLCFSRSREEWSKVTRKTAGQAGTVQAIVVAPSRELAMQIVKVAQTLLPSEARRAVQQCIGGANILRQKESLKTFKPVLVVGTPGRLAELSRDGSLQTHRCGILVLDEVDQLLAPQFREDMVRLNDHIGKKYVDGRQTILVSATLTNKILSLCESWCPNADRIFVGHERAVEEATDVVIDSENLPESTAHELGRTERKNYIVRGEGPGWGWGAPGMSYQPEIDMLTQGSAGGFGHDASEKELISIAPGLEHLFITSPPQHKVDTLRRAINASNSSRALVFMNFQHRLKDAAARLSTRGMKVGYLHGEMSKQERKSTLDAFKAGKYRALLVSDVAARGLDIPDCDAVFNLELPTDASHYAHRAGRTGRAGRQGIVITIATFGETFVIEKISNRIGVQFVEVEPKEGILVAAKREKQSIKPRFKFKQGKKGS